MTVAWLVAFLCRVATKLVDDVSTSGLGDRENHDAQFFLHESVGSIVCGGYTVMSPAWRAATTASTRFSTDIFR